MALKSFWSTLPVIAKALLFMSFVRAAVVAHTTLRHATKLGQPAYSKRLPLIIFFPILSLLKSLRAFQNLLHRRGELSLGIDGTKLDDLHKFTLMMQRIQTAGPRLPGSEAHRDFVRWLEEELLALPSIQLRSRETPILAWQPKHGCSLQDAAELTLKPEQGGSAIVPLAGAVPYSAPSKIRSGQLLYLPRDRRIEGESVRGKIVLRDFPTSPLPYALGMLPAYHITSDLDHDVLNFYDRPGLADQPLHYDLLDAGNAGAAGIIFMSDIDREQIASYYEPHKGTHYEVPGVYVGADEAMLLKQQALDGCSASLSVEAIISSTTSPSLSAVLPGQCPERVIYVTHTDGNTCVQENGPIALLALARYFASQPLASRRRTIEFAFNTGHLHISRESSLAQARELDKAWTAGDDTLALVIPVEHLGTREIEAVPHSSGRPCRQLRFSGRGEVMFWCVGPSPPVVKAVKNAVRRRKLDRVIVTRGVSLPQFRKAPTFTSFGGIGTYYHNFLLPTASLISGPWSLWAPHFGTEAVDVERLRQQTLALGDIYVEIDGVPRPELAQGYERYRSTQREDLEFEVPPEQASDARTLDGNVIRY